jgi:DNA-binding CsgD family transcriptional regulator
MVSLRRADLRAILDFIVDASELEFDLPYPPEIVARLGELVASPGLVYRENDVHEHRTPVLVTATGAFQDEDDAVYWALGPDPIIRYRVATGDLGSTRLSDVAARRAYRESALYREYFAGQVEFMIDLGLPPSDGRLRSFLFCRRREDGDFSARDRAMLEALRPHFVRFEGEAERRRQLAALLRIPEPRSDDVVAGDEVLTRLTSREREIVELVAAGLTNAEIATRLWVAPSTVKKHLENVYAKLGVGRRTAAATLLARVH